MRRRLLFRVLGSSLLATSLVSLAACGSGLKDPFADEETVSSGACTFQAEVSGSARIEFSADNPAICETQSSDAALFARFSSANERGTIELTIEELGPGESGKDFPAIVAVSVPAGRVWRGECLASAAEQTFVNVEPSQTGELHRYQVSGTASCPKPLRATSRGNDTVKVESLSFQAQFLWRQ